MSVRRHRARPRSLTHARARGEPELWLRAGAVALPILKCAVCPACLSVFGSLLAGARFGFLEDERLHGAVILAALLADFLILGASLRHHRRWGPLGVCAAGALLAVAGHFTSELVEYGGLSLLLAAGIWNLILLRRHHREGADCCAHRHAEPLAEPRALLRDSTSAARRGAVS